MIKTSSRYINGKELMELIDHDILFTVGLFDRKQWYLKHNFNQETILHIRKSGVMGGIMYNRLKDLGLDIDSITISKDVKLGNK